MSGYQSVASLFCGLSAAVFLVGVVFLGPDAVAQETPGDGASSCTCPNDRKPDSQKLWPRPKLAGASEVRPVIAAGDEIAALEAVQLALSEVGDGSTYVWHSTGSTLSGAIQPTSSFRDSQGQICRHIVVTLAASGLSRQTEGVACRQANGIWRLEG